AETIHQLEDDKLASEILNSRFPWQDSPRDGACFARRAKALGAIEASQGAVEKARKQFLLAAQLAEEEGEASLALQSHAALAELEWRHDSERVRRGAIKRVR